MKLMPASFPVVCMCVVALSICSAARGINIETVLIGNAGNPADSRFMNDGTCCYGSVAYEYRIGKYEVTNDEYVEFLRAVATETDTQEIYEPFMGSTVHGGIVRSGGPTNFTYTVKPNMGNKPVTPVTIDDAMRFANWLHNGQPSGAQTPATTENGAYDLTGPDLPQRSASATWFLPSGDEWYKAAYYDPRDVAGGGVPGHYALYATGSLVQPTVANANAVGDISNPGVNTVNYLSGADWNGVDGHVTTVGSAGPLSASYYGTFDQAGNVAEHNDDVTLIYHPNVRTTRGGNSNSQRDAISAEVRQGCPGCYAGFRIASVLDPPGPGEELFGDYNDDGTVDAADYVVWRKHLGSTSITLPNDSTPGSVMQVDYTVWRENFGATSGSGAAMSQPLESVVPEPAGATLMLGALTAFSVLFLDPRCRAS